MMKLLQELISNFYKYILPLTQYIEKNISSSSNPYDIEIYKELGKKIYDAEVKGEINSNEDIQKELIIELKAIYNFFKSSLWEHLPLNNIKTEANNSQEKKNKDPFGLNAYARELVKSLEEELEEGRKKKKDPKKGTGKKPEGSGRRLYTDEDPSDTVGIKFRTKEDIVDTLNKASFKAKSHARQSQIINLIHQRVRAAYGKAKDPETKARLKRGLDYIEKRKEASKEKTKRLRAQKENVIPKQDEKAAPYGSGYKEINEGMYDSLTRRLTKATIDQWKKDFEANPKIKQSVLDIDIDEEDSKGRPIEFNYVAQLTFDKKEDGYTVDGTSNSGEEKDKYAFIATIFTVNPEVLPQAWSKIYMDVIDVIRHEIEHLTQAGENVRSGKYKEDDIQIRDMINKLKVLPKKNYYLLDKEVEAMLQGLYLKAKKSKKPFKDVVNNYLDNAPGIDTPEDKEMILNLWRSRRKALSLPVLEQNKEVMDYEIYSDMDGVLTDFDAAFEKISGGIHPRKYEDKYGKDKFWEIIDEKGVGYWVGMSWMSDGKQYWDYIKQYNPVLLSSPSKSQTSRLGKRLWVRNQLPGTKLILARAKDKQNYARKNRILIDDRKSNIDEWRAQGGIGILHTSAADTIKQLKELGL